jgi:fucose 4-O-acetylase-like acetyltransferase
MVRRLLYPNGLAILFVVLFHTTSWGMTAMFAWTPRYLPVSEPVFDQTGSLPYYWVRFVEQVVVVAVPALLFVSGYFVAFTTGQRDNLAWSQIWGRIKKLLIPYTIWSLLIWFSWFILLRDVYSPSTYAIDFLTGNTTITYYYVPLLIQFFVLSPFIIRFAKKKGDLVDRHWDFSTYITGGDHDGAVVRLREYPKSLGMARLSAEMAIFNPLVLVRVGDGCWISYY